MSDIINDALLRDIDTFVRENETRIVRDMARLVSVPSVESAPAPGAPFGAGPREALACVLDMAQELGLDTVNCEDKLGYAVIGEDHGQGYLATITHVDIVPTGDGWPADPFVLREQDGYLLGRGIMDDKGPSVLCLYALKYLKDAALALRYPIRALFGSNEETHMADVEHYIEHYPAPLFCFSPDADFPLIHGEKGIYHAVLRSHHSPENVLEISGGIVINAVPDSAAALVRADALESSGRVLVKQREPGLWELSASGVSGHASMPEGTVNAIGVLVEYLLTHDIPSERERPYFDFLSKLHLSPDGSGVGLKSSDGRFTPLTAVGGRISTEGGVISQTVDVRYGTAMSGEKITASLTAAAAGAADVEVLGDSVPFYMGPENPAVQACLASYNQITGEDARSYTIGGGTYARHFPNAVAFGPEHPERPYPDFCGPIHGVNEAARKSDLMEALKIYILALIRLEALDY